MIITIHYTKEDLGKPYRTFFRDKFPDKDLHDILWQSEELDVPEDFNGVRLSVESKNAQEYIRKNFPDLLI